MALIGRAVDAGRKTDPTGEMTAVWEPMRRPDAGEHRGAGQQTDACHALQAPNIDIVLGERFELAFDGSDICFESRYLLEETAKYDFQRRRDSVILDDFSGTLLSSGRSFRNSKAEFTQEAPQSVDALSSGARGYDGAVGSVAARQSAPVRV